MFDCGLIGEGALHIAAAVHARGLLAPGGRLLPARARVFAQPIQFGRLGRLATHIGPQTCNGKGANGDGSAAAPPAAAPAPPAFDLAPLEAYTWGAAGSDYRAADLAAALGPPQPNAPPAAACAWSPLAPPQEVFAFDFSDPADVAAHMAPQTRALSFVADAAGECNAVASWFELDLTADGGARLTTSPYAAAAADPIGEAPAGTPAAGAAPACAGRAAYAASWQQAVHPLPGARRVERGGALDLIASHDTYSISFGYSGPAPGGAAGDASPCASVEGSGADEAGAAADAVWAARCAEVRALQGHLARQAAQAPHRHRCVVRAVLALAAAPASGGADAAQAAALCARMMM